MSFFPTSDRVLFLLFLPSLLIVPSFASDYGIEGRYSFSLTTFSPDGRLAQVERAARASALGPPVVAVRLAPDRGGGRRQRQRDGDGNGNGFGSGGGASVALASPRAFPSALIRDDGTARFARITDGMVVAHSGVGADGRAVVAAAQRLAVEHAFAFEEEIPLETFLEEVSLLFQRYTMKAGSRPFGCSLLVVHCGSGTSRGAEDEDEDEDEDESGIYRIDPSGAVQYMGDVGCIGGGDHEKIVRALDERGCVMAEDAEDAARTIADVLREESKRSSPLVSGDLMNEKRKKEGVEEFLVATFAPRVGLVVDKHSYT